LQLELGSESAWEMELVQEVFARRPPLRYQRTDNYYRRTMLQRQVWGIPEILH
jgi:hypothetical protein